MPTSYFKRLRMEIDLRRRVLSEPLLPEGYEWRAWHPVLTEAHARAKFESFRDEVDSLLFPCLGSVGGCRKLMRDISLRRGFVPAATWLICLEANEFLGPVPCGTIQGVIQNWRWGSIQNVGIAPEHRGQGLGRALMLKALHGFRTKHVKRVYLEVTADNEPAVELYRSVGFVHMRTSYRAVDVEDVLLPAS